MRIGFLGKGGSGKSTISAAFINYLVTKGNHVLAIDADINVHLQEALGIEGTAKHLGEKFSEVAQFLDNDSRLYTNLGFTPIPSFGSIPPSKETKLISVHPDDAFLKKYALQQGNISLLTVGKHNESDVLNGCYHNKLNALELIYHRILDTAHDYVVADSTAGIDSLGTSMFMVHDLTIFVVEPTHKSISVYLNYKEKLKKYPLALKVVVNKVYDKEDMEFVQEFISSREIMGYIGVSENLKRFEQGESGAFSEFMKENEEVFVSILHTITQQKKDWEAYQSMLMKLYVDEASGWWGSYYGMKNLHEVYDKDFSYQKVAAL